MLRIALIVVFCLPFAGVLLAQPATRIAAVESGVLRWQDDHSEVALFGVNYYVPFSIDYKVLKDRGLDHEQAIRDDVAHFARLGLTAIRLHCWDREISDHEGNLRDNEHLRLLDYLIAECQKRGIYSVMTPIAWWQSSEKGGFSDLYTMHQMTTDLKARAAQCNYLKQYMGHVNRYTGRAFKDHPAIVAIELINEPQYPPGTTDAQVTDYINALAQAVRDTGCRKPIFYNCWGPRHGAAAVSTLDGVTFGWYPTGLVSGGMLRTNFLPSVEDYPSMRDPLLAQKAKIVYEFDAADVQKSYMYPAMARAFRSGGAHIATQFQYEPMCIGAGNPNWQTHYLNLAYTPAKAISFAIAAEVFRRTPRLTTFEDNNQKPGFLKKPGFSFRASYEDDLSEMLSEDTFMYSNDTKASPPAPEKLTRLAGCGSSPLVQYEGTGAYFLDKLSPGVWKLQVYPDAAMVADPYSGGDNEKIRILWGKWEMQVRLPDLGADFEVGPCDKDRRSQKSVRAQNQTFTVTPGEYLLAASGAAVPDVLPGVEWLAPPSSTAPPTAFLDAPSSWREGKPCPVEATVAVAGLPECTLYLKAPGAAAIETIPMKRTKTYLYSALILGQLMRPGQAEFYISIRDGDRTHMLPPGAVDEIKSWPGGPFAVLRAEPNTPLPPVSYGGPPGKSARASIVPGRDDGRSALHLEADGFGPPPSCAGMRWKASGAPPDPAHYNALSVLARGGPDTTAVEIGLVQRDGNAFGADIPLWPDWREATVPLDHLRPLWKTTARKPDLSQLDCVSITFGAWLFEGATDRQHMVEIQDIRLVRKASLWTVSVAPKDAPFTLIEPAKRKLRTHGHEAAQRIVPGMGRGQSALRISVKGFDPQPDCTSFRLAISPETACCADELAQARSVIIKARAVHPTTTKIEMVLIEDDGAPWGLAVPLSEKWQAIKVPLQDLKYMAHWHMAPRRHRGGPGDHIRPDKTSAVNICFGAWLYGDDYAKPQGFEIQDISLSREGK